ncbi:glucuronate isomerase [Clostridium formicaceticum]|uniref:Uronate isomerase n=1 Tax=Clostridium formicaceticum TaxID=1497 RepID=A0AAC9WH63_9CLOT|nr:glucuronate isomerase [Clostridium formicaceticum]AOY77969.1 glucuronate isomerase [Clostridium formicaceticum]ARE88591.1 Uronate isomerase [Clostridium formicaceticum]
MTRFMKEDFLLESKSASILFHTFAKSVPIFDYHCHLDPKEIYEDKHFEDLAELWLGGDHYKWRLMRANGTAERFITGEASGYEKFRSFASCMPYAMGNPLYHWSHLELQRYFDIEETLSEKTAKAIWNKANARIKQPDFSARQLIKDSNVYALCTTDDPVDSLEYHLKLKNDTSFKTKVLPAMRPDKVLDITDEGFRDYIRLLASAANMTISNFEELCGALKQRIDFFDEVGCRASDHGFTHLPYETYTKDEIETIFKKAMEGDIPTQKEANQYKTALMVFLGSEYKKKNWAMELHIGVLRNNSTKRLSQIGINAGFDSIHDANIALNLSRFLDHLEKQGDLPKTVLFTMNPKDNWVIASMAGNFQSDEAISKMQFGTAWWMQDHRDGMQEHMKCFANSGLLGRFIGMLTDSRSFVSYTRHEYFRRILCNLMGAWIENGEYADDLEEAGRIIEDICLNNARRYFEV